MSRLLKTGLFLFASRTNWQYNPPQMDESNEKPRRYKWPWLVAAGLVLGIVLAVIWVHVAVKTVERERDWNGPITGNTSK